MEAPEAYHFSPAHPKLPRQLILRVGYVEDYFDSRTKPGSGRVSERQGGRVKNVIVFSRPLDEGRERRVDDRIADQPF